MKRLLLAIGALAVLTGCQDDSEATAKEKVEVAPIVFEVAPDVDYGSLTNENVKTALQLDNITSVDISDEGDGTYYLTVKLLATDDIRDEEPLENQAKKAFQASRKFKDVSSVNLVYFDENDELVLNTVLTREKLDRLDFERASLALRADRYIYIPQT